MLATVGTAGSDATTASVSSPESPTYLEVRRPPSGVALMTTEPRHHVHTVTVGPGPCPHYLGMGLWCTELAAEGQACPRRVSDQHDDSPETEVERLRAENERLRRDLGAMSAPEND